MEREREMKHVSMLIKTNKPNILCRDDDNAALSAICWSDNGTERQTSGGFHRNNKTGRNKEKSKEATKQRQTNDVNVINHRKQWH